MNSPYEVIKSVLVTEKCSLLKEQNKYAFKVDKDAKKQEIADAIEKIFGVEVKSVNVSNYSGKLKRAGRSAKMGRRANWKKAVVTLAKGTIEVLQ